MGLIGLGLILLVVGLLVAKLAILVTVGLVILVVGLILAALSFSGHRVGGGPRRWYW